MLEHQSWSCLNQECLLRHTTEDAQWYLLQAFFDTAWEGPLYLWQCHRRRQQLPDLTSIA